MILMRRKASHCQHAYCLCLLLLLGTAQLAAAAPTGLNVIPTTDLAPLHNIIAGIQNGNTSIPSPAFYQAPDAVLQTEFGITPNIEAGADWIQPPDVSHQEITLNIKGVLLNEDDVMPGLAAGMINLAANQAPGFFVTCSKTLNYDQQQRERFRAHHRRNRKLLGRRVHAGLMVDGHGLVEPFVGTDLQLNESAVLQSDWIAGPGNALSLGMAYVLPDQKTVLNPAMLYSNNTRRIDGFALNISRQVAW